MLQERTWLLIGRKMAGEASPQELKELEEILKNNPELHFSLQALTELWQQSGTEDLNELESAYESHLLKMKCNLADFPGNSEDFVENSTLFASSKRSFLSRKGLMLTAVMLAIILAVGGILYTIPSKKGIAGNAGQPVASEILTRYGSKTNIILPDGSKVWLNAGSKLTYDKNFGEKTRNVVLTGEAYFDVVHNAEKPFVIHTSVMDIKVLGTEFNVKSYPDESTTEASLIRGSIEVTLKDKRAEKIIMKPNEKLVVNNEKIELPSVSYPVRKALKQTAPIFSLIPLNYFSQDSTILETSWVSNRLVFEDESFEEIAKRMSRWYGVEFQFNDPEIKEYRFTGNFKNETVDEALVAMQISSEFGYRIIDKHIYITKN